MTDYYPRHPSIREENLTLLIWIKYDVTTSRDFRNFLFVLNFTFYNNNSILLGTHKRFEAPERPRSLGEPLVTPHTTLGRYKTTKENLKILTKRQPNFTLLSKPWRKPQRDSHKPSRKVIKHSPTIDKSFLLGMVSITKGDRKSHCTWSTPIN